MPDTPPSAVLSARGADSGCTPARPPAWVVRTACTVLALLAAATTWSRHTAGFDSSPGLLTLDVVVAGVSIALVPVLLGAAQVPVLSSRRLRPPVPAAVLLAALAVVSPVATPPATLGTLQVADRRPLRPALLVAAVGSAAHAVQGLWRPTGGLSYGWWVVLVLLAHGALVGWGAWAQNRRQVVRGLRERAERAEALQATVAARAREQERARIAREMHDVLAHRLSLLATWAGALEYRPDSSPEQLAHASGVLRTGIHQALDELREVVGMLREPDGGPSAPTPGLADLPRLVEESRAAGTPVELRLDGLTDPAGPPDTAPAGVPLPPAADRAVFRVVQECLTNARRHAPRQPVRVSVRGAPADGVDVEVANPLPARTVTEDDDPPSSGAGLLGLRERASLAGGRLGHGVERADDGTEVFVVRCWLPWRHGDDGAGPGRR